MATNRGEKTPQDSDGVQMTPSRQGSAYAKSHVEDAVFGEMTEDGPNYRGLGWIPAVAILTKTMIGLGVLSIPSTFHTLGLIPGVILLWVISGITNWSNYMVGVFKLNHPEVYTFDEVGLVMFGKVGREVFATAYILYYIFTSGSAFLGISIGLNSVSTHAACTAAFVAVAAITAFLLGSIRTLGKIGWIAWVGVTCMLTALFAVTIAVALQERPAAAPQEGLWVPDYKLFGTPTFTEAITAVSSLIFSFAGTSAFYSIVAEMREPKHYTRALIISQSIVVCVYTSVAVVIYYYCGSYVASPALGSAGVLMKKVGYGFALPGLLVTAMLMVHIPGKYLFLRILRGSDHLVSNTFIHWGTWVGCTGAVTITGYVIASAIPVFGTLVSLIGSLLGTFMSFQPYGCMWLFDNWSKKSKTPYWYFMVGWSVFMIVIGTFCMVAGTYGSVVAIINDYAESGGSAAFSCADNSNSVPK